MTAPAERPPVWFERAIVPELAAEVAAAVTILGPSTPADPYSGLAAARAAVASTMRYDAALMDCAPGLRLIARTGIGYDLVDVVEATRRGIAVCNTPDAPTISTAEHAVTLMLMVAKGVKRAESRLRQGSGDYYAHQKAIELRGKVLGLVGCGRIARHVAAICGAMGMRVTAHDPFLAQADLPPGVDLVATLEQLLRIADVVSVHVPLSDATRHLFGAAQFRWMKPGAVFVNTARGGLVDSDALLAALAAGHLFGAGLDVTEPEPLPIGHPLLGRDDVVVTPHVASATADAKVRIFRAAFEQVVDGLAGRRPGHLVNPEVWATATSAGG
ncbi:MAG TPA: NAD(P)-dependent oxidoreductase [Candidatus Saccharimonadia bacterium]|nr:NAD(P)-dependent oxidoreductase [Candidatus Saccharimonadia bacterium]